MYQLLMMVISKHKVSPQNLVSVTLYVCLELWHHLCWAVKLNGHSDIFRLIFLQNCDNWLGKDCPKWILSAVFGSFSTKVSGEINLHCHWTFTTLNNTASLKWWDMMTSQWHHACFAGKRAAWCHRSDSFFVSLDKLFTINNNE